MLIRDPAAPSVREFSLLCIRYRVPFPRDVIASLNRFREDYGVSSSENRDLLQQLVGELRSNALSIEISGRFSMSFLEHLKTRVSDLERDGWKLFKAASENPAQAFGDMLLGAGDASYYPGVDKDFIDLVDDVIRDGRVTPAEMAFLEEKRLVYSVSSEDFQHLLQTKRRFHRSLLKLVEEICRDGKVTPAERRLLADKAREFGGFHNEEIEHLLRRGLSLQRYARKPDAESLFPQLTSGLFLARFILHDRALTDAFFNAADEYLSSLVDDASLKSLSLSLAAALDEVLCTPTFDGESDLHGILDRLFAIPEVSPIRQPITATSKIATKELESEILANGLRFQIKSVDNPRLPLFFHEVIGSIVTVFINQRHPFLQGSDEGALHLTRKLALSITLTRIELYGDDEVVEDFFDRLSMNDRIVARQQSSTQLTRRA